MTIAPVVMVWRKAEVIDESDGTAEKRFVMVPHPKYRGKADRQYEDGAEYTLAPVETRSRAQHSRYFAELNSIYQSLPETLSARWISFDHFRKWILIETGWYTEKDFTFEGYKAEAKARALAAFVRAENDYARIFVTCVNDDDTEASMIEAARQAWNATHGEFVVKMRAALRAALAVRGGAWKVIIRIAKSQDHASMKKGDFKDSSDEVLNFATGLIGTTRREVRDIARQS